MAENPACSAAACVRQDSLSCADTVQSLPMCGDRGLPAMCPGAGAGEGLMMTAVGRAAMVMIAAVPVVLAGASGASAAASTLADPGTAAVAGPGDARRGCPVPPTCTWAGPRRSIRCRAPRLATGSRRAWATAGARRRGAAKSFLVVTVRVRPARDAPDTNAGTVLEVIIAVLAPRPCAS